MGLFNNMFVDKNIVAVLNSILSNVCDLGCRLGATSNVTISALSSEICPSGTVILTATITTTFGANTYQWQELINGVWTDISGATAITYSGILTDPEEYSYRVLVTSCGGKIVVSNAVTVAVVSPTHLVYDSSDDNEICNGGTTILHGEVVGCAGVQTFQWQEFNGVAWVNIPGATSIDYTTPNLLESGGTSIDVPGSYEYRVESLCDGCGGVYSDGEYIVVNADPTVIATTEDDEICNGGISILHTEVIGGAGGNIYQWQELIDGVWTPIPGAEGADYITPELSTGTYIYRVGVTQDSGCQAFSNFVVITAVEDPVVTISADDETIPVEGVFILSSVVTGGSETSSYQWQRLIADVWTDIFGANSDTWSNTGLDPELNLIQAGTYPFRLLVIQDSGCEAYSNTVTITVT